MSVLEVKPRQLVWQSSVLRFQLDQTGTVTVGTPILRQYKSQLEIPEGSVEQPAWQSYGMAAQALDARYAPNAEVAFYVQWDQSQLDLRSLQAKLTVTDYGTDGFSGRLDNAGMVAGGARTTTADVTAEFYAGRGYLLVPLASVQVGKIELTITQLDQPSPSVTFSFRSEVYSCQDTPVGIGGPKNGTPALLVPEMETTGINAIVSPPGTTVTAIPSIITGRANQLTVFANTDNAVTIVVRSWFLGHQYYVDQTFAAATGSSTQTFTTGLSHDVEILVTHTGGGGADANVYVEAIARS